MHKYKFEVDSKEFNSLIVNSLLILYLMLNV